MAAIRIEPIGDGAIRMRADFGGLMPQRVLVEVQSALRPEVRRARGMLKTNVTGGVLNRVTGRLADSIKTSVRARGWSVSAIAGSKWYIGRFWEDGHVRHGRQYGPRKWAAPVADALRASTERAITAAVERALSEEGR